MTKEQFIAIQSALSYSNQQMADAVGVSVTMINHSRRLDGARPLTKRVAKGAIAALNDKIIELQRLRLFVE